MKSRVMADCAQRLLPNRDQLEVIMASRNDRRVAGSVTHDITIQCIDTSGRTHDLETIFSYAQDDPFAVTITFITPEGDLPWTVSRDLLLRGMTAPIGEA